MIQVNPHEESIEALLAPLPRVQGLLVRAVWDTYLGTGGWPAWDHVVGVLEEHDEDPKVTIQALPSWPWGTLGMYRAVWWGAPSSVPGPDDEVALTVLGLAHCRPESANHLSAVLEALRFFAARFTAEPPTPNSALMAQVTSDELTAEYLRGGAGAETANRLPEFVHRILDHEPSPWSRGFSQPQDGPWTQYISREIRAFQGVRTIEDYLQALARTLHPRPVSTPTLGHQSRGPSSEPSRIPLTVMFTDIVGSVALTSQLGDAKWVEKLREHDALMRGLLRERAGTEVNTTGDGFLAVFESPSEGVRCAAGFVADVRQLGLEVRVGLHLGECEVQGSNIIGIAPDIASRVMSLAQPNQVLVTSTVREAVAGSELTFDLIGDRELKGVGPWRLFALQSEELPEPRRAASREGWEVAHSLIQLDDGSWIQLRVWSSGSEELPGIVCEVMDPSGRTAVSDQDLGWLAVPSFTPVSQADRLYPRDFPERDAPDRPLLRGIYKVTWWYTEEKDEAFTIRRVVLCEDQFEIGPGAQLVDD